MITVYTYLVSYVYTNSNNSHGYGRNQVHSDSKFDDITKVIEIEKELKTKFDNNGLVILNFHLLRTKLCLQKNWKENCGK